MSDGYVNFPGGTVATKAQASGPNALAVEIAATSDPVEVTVVGSGVASDWTQLGAYFHDSTVSSATTLTPETGATHILLQTTTQGVYVTLDGTTPTSSNGLLLTPEMGARLLPLQGANAVKVLEAAASATIRGAWVA